MLMGSSYPLIFKAQALVGLNLGFSHGHRMLVLSLLDDNPLSGNDYKLINNQKLINLVGLKLSVFDKLSQINMG